MANTRSAVYGCNWLQLLVPRRIQSPYPGRNPRPGWTAGGRGSNRVVPGIGDVQVAFRIHRDTRGVLNGSQFALPIHPERPAIVVTTAPAVIFRIVVVSVGDIQRPRTVHRNGLRTTEPRGAARAIVRPEHLGLARQRRHHAAGGNLPDRVVAGSATYNLPAPSTATPSGRLNRAALPVPSVLPLDPAKPASVVTMPPGQFSGSCDCWVRHIHVAGAVDCNSSRAD